MTVTCHVRLGVGFSILGGAVAGAISKLQMLEYFRFYLLGVKMLNLYVSLQTVHHHRLARG